MKDRYFNEASFDYIMKLVSDNRLEQAVVEFERYLQKYPEDYCAYSYYADALIKIGKFDDAEELLDRIPVASKIPKLAKENVLLMKLKLFSCRTQYDECLKILRDNFEIFERRKWGVTETLIFLKKQLGLLLVDNYDGLDYKIDQITNYSEEKAIECIKKYHCVNNGSSPAHFNDNFPVEDFYFKIRNLLPLDDKIYSSITENIYIFKYDTCGKVNNKTVNHIKVIALQNSNDIITMYPYENKEKFQSLDLTPIQEQQPVKVKRLSQIEKFNQRYSINN